MRKFRYWKPGGIIGEILANTPFEAAKLLLGGTPIYCGGCQPMIYFNQGDLKLWEVFSWQE